MLLQSHLLLYGMVSVTSASSYVTSAPRYQSRSSTYIRGLVSRNSTELAEAVPIEGTSYMYKSETKSHALQIAQELVPPLFLEKAGDKKQVSITRKCHNHGTQANPWHREEEVYTTETYTTSV